MRLGKSLCSWVLITYKIIKWHMRIIPNNLAGLSPLSSSDKDAFAELFTHVMIGLGPRLDAHFFRSIIQPAYGADVNHGFLVLVTALPASVSCLSSTSS